MLDEDEERTDGDIQELDSVTAAMDQDDFCNINQNFIKDGDVHEDEEDYKPESWEDEENQAAGGEVKKEKSDLVKRRKRKAGAWSKPRYMPKVKKRDVVNAEVSSQKHLILRR